MRDTIINIGAVVACVVAVIGYILAIWSSKKGKQDESIIDWKLFAKLNASSSCSNRDIRYNLFGITHFLKINPMNFDIHGINL